MLKRKLLLADDSATIQKVIKLTFVEEGIDVTAVGDGDTAVEKLAEIEPDIVLADVNMPGLNGYQICEIIRKNELTRELPVILLVGSFEPFDEAEAQKVGASAYFTKPFHSIRELVSKVSELLETVEEPPEDEIPEANDIDSLYQDSLTPAPMQSEYSDAGMDDEIIETSYADSDSEMESINFGVPDEVEGADETEEDDFGVAFGDSDNSHEQESDVPAFETTELKESPTEESEQRSYATMPDFRSPFDEPAADDDRHTAETTKLTPLVFDEPEPEASVSELASAKTISFEQIPEETPPPQYEFDEIDLLELPKPGDGKSYQFTTPDHADASGSRIQVVSISPELMEIIVQKVVEKLAEKY